MASLTYVKGVAGHRNKWITHVGKILQVNRISRILNAYKRKFRLSEEIMERSAKEEEEKKRRRKRRRRRNEITFFSEYILTCTNHSKQIERKNKSPVIKTILTKILVSYYFKTIVWSYCLLLCNKNADLKKHTAIKYLKITLFQFHAPKKSKTFTKHIHTQCVHSHKEVWFFPCQ